jgi:RNA polymerase sigma factor (sigma-70 family)
MEEQIIKKLRQQDIQTQELFYKSYATKMFRICYRYISNESDAAEIMNIGLYKVFTQIKNFKDGGVSELEAWMKKIMVNECLQFIRSRKKIRFVDESEALTEYSPILPEINLEAEDYYKLIKQLPDTYRTVFNLYVIEGFSHKEISEMLQIPENTSRSHLSRARRMLIEKIENN